MFKISQTKYRILFSYCSYKLTIKFRAGMIKPVILLQFTLIAEQANRRLDLTRKTVTHSLKVLSESGQVRRAAGVRGVAWWHTGAVRYGSPQGGGEEMWDALTSFVDPRPLGAARPRGA